MSAEAPEEESIRGSLEACYRAEYGAILASLLRRTESDFELAEAALSDAFTAALERWDADGEPDRPGAWIRAVAERRLTDRLRRPRAQALSEDTELPERDGAPREVEHELVIPQEEFPHEDDRLRLIFTCCHPALALEAQVALTLNAVCGLRANEIARAFLVREVTMSQRLVRAKQKIRVAKIPYAVPPDERISERLGAVLRVTYLVFNEGYGATFGDALVRRGLCDEAIRLARVLCDMLPHEAEVGGLLALMLLMDSRRNARTSPDGELVLLADQDRSLWDRDEIEEGLALIRTTLLHNGKTPAGPYQIQAAIAALHAEADSEEQTDWEQIAGLYEVLLEREPSPVVALNHAVAVAMHAGPAKGLELVEALATDGRLENYRYLHSTRADLLRRLGKRAEARAAYRKALELADNAQERRFLSRRLAELETS